MLVLEHTFIDSLSCINATETRKSIEYQQILLFSLVQNAHLKYLAFETAKQAGLPISN